MTNLSVEIQFDEANASVFTDNRRKCTGSCRACHNCQRIKQKLVSELIFEERNSFNWPAILQASSVQFCMNKTLHIESIERMISEEVLSVFKKKL